VKVIYHHTVGPWMERRLADLADSHGLQVEVVAPDDHLSLANALPGVEVIWHVLEPLTAEQIAVAPHLKLIQKIGVGVNTISVDTASDRGIAVCNMPGTNSRSVAELTLGLIFSCLRRVTWLHNRTANGAWSVSPEVPESMMELAGRTVGLVGYGDIPRILAPVLEVLGAKVLYTATSEKHDASGEFREIEQLLKESDIVSLHLPLVQETEQIIDSRRLGMMKQGAVLINTARGGLIDQPALVEALRGGQLTAAGLDVFAEEPVDPDDPILKLENVVLCPHVAWQTRDTLERSIEFAVENCRRLKEHLPLLSQVNET